MKLHLTCLAIAAACALNASSALALSEDDKTMGSPSATAKFSDPDDHTPSAINLQGSSAGSAGAVDPSSVRYDYDPSSGSYIPHKN